MYAEITDVEARWIASRPLPSDSVISAYLQDASLMLDVQYPTLADEAAAKPVVAETAKSVCVQMLIRLFTNPDKYRQLAEGVGSNTGSATFGTETLGIGLELTDSDRASLAKVLGVGRSQAGSFSTLPHRPDLRG